MSTNQWVLLVVLVMGVALSVWRCLDEDLDTTAAFIIAMAIVVGVGIHHTNERNDKIEDMVSHCLLEGHTLHLYRGEFAGCSEDGKFVSVP